MKQSIIFVAGLHGNEQMPVRALQENNIPFILGNPIAYEKNVRFTERDINASFGFACDAYECRRAQEILNEIPENLLIVDFHTTTSEDRPFVVIVNETMITLARRTGIERVVLMRHNIKKGNALINHRNGISVEVGQHTTQESYRTTLNVAQSILNGTERPVVLYEVYAEIRQPGNYENFREHQDGFIPVLTKEPEYEREGCFGLKARKL